MTAKTKNEDHEDKPAAIDEPAEATEATSAAEQANLNAAQQIEDMNAAATAANAPAVDHGEHVVSHEHDK